MRGERCRNSLRRRASGPSRLVGRLIIGSGEGEAVAHTSGSHSRLHSIRMTDVDLRNCHIAGQELTQGLDASTGSTIERIAHRSRVWILAVSQTAEAHRVLASGRLVLFHLYTSPRDGKAILLACCPLLLFLYFFPPLPPPPPSTFRFFCPEAQ